MFALLIGRSDVCVCSLFLCFCVTNNCQIFHKSVSRDFGTVSTQGLACGTVFTQEGKLKADFLKARVKSRRICRLYGHFGAL